MTRSLTETEIRSILIPVTQGNLLLPNANIAEIVAYSAPERSDDSPAWLLGNVIWQGWQVPVISFPVLTEQAASESIDDGKICISKCLIENERLPYIGLLAQGFPRLVTITEALMTEIPDSAQHIAVAGEVRVGDQQAAIPDLHRLGQLVAHAMFGTLPLAG
ncbi:MAG: chemotaxis protein CheW [Pseudomonadota bacterium]